MTLSTEKKSLLTFSSQVDPEKISSKHSGHRASAPSPSTSDDKMHLKSSIDKKSRAFKYKNPLSI